MPSIDQLLEEVLSNANRAGGFAHTLLANPDGMILAASGEEDESQLTAAAFCSLFEEAFSRASTDLGFSELDELTLMDGNKWRYVIRLVTDDLFLVARVPPKKRWRRVTNTLCAQVARIMRDVA